MFVLSLLLLNVLMLFFTFSTFSDKKRLFVLLAESISVFLCLFSLTSAFLWIFEAFTVEFCLLVVTVFVTVVFIINYFKNGKKGKDFFALGDIKVDKSNIINRSIIIIATLLSLGSYATVGIGYNDGNAQIQAISILNGQNSLKFEVDEYENIAPGSQYEFYFFDAINNIDSENFTANYSINKVDTEEEDVKEYRMTGEYGSNPVYPSILALSACIFGIKRMAFIQAIFAFCLFVFVDELLRKLKCDWKLRSVLVLLLGVSPIIIYCNRTTLVEPLIGFCMIMFMYFLLCKKKKLQVLSALGVVTFAFLHSNFYTMLPLFLILYWMYFIHTGKIRHLVSSGIVITGYILSFGFLNITAYENTSINYKLGLSFLGNNYYIFVIAAAAITVLFGIIFAIFVKKIDSQKLVEFKRNKGRKVFKILMAAISATPIPIMAYIIFAECNTFGDFLNITFVAFLVCSGVLLVPYILFRLISARYRMGIKETSVVLAFVYTVIMYSCVMKVLLDGYYYESRYISSFIPFIVLAAGMMLKLLKKEEKYFIPIIGIIIMLIPHSTSLMKSDAETRFNADVFEDVINIVQDRTDDESVIVIEKSLLRYYYYPLIQMTDADVYPIDADYFDTFCRDINDYDSKFIYITDDSGTRYLGKGRVRYLNNNIQKITSPENTSMILGLPNKFVEYDVGKVQVLEVSALGKMLNYELYDDLEKEDINLNVKDINIENGMATITVSVTDGSKIYHNERYLLSYHLEYENEEDLYDFPRYEIGPVIYKDFEIKINLSEQPEDVTVVIDIVEEGVEWYSWENRVPVILFTENEGEWDYKIYNFYTRL